MCHFFFYLLIKLMIQGKNNNTTQFIGSCNVKLNELIEMLNQSIITKWKRCTSR